MIRIVLLILFVLLVLAFKFLPWWGILALGAAIIILSKFVAKRAILWLFSMPFRAKGKVLRGAVVEVHSIRATAPPIRKPSAERPRLASETIDDSDQSESEDADEDFGDDAEPDIPRNYYEVDVTITPGTPTGPFHLWEYAEVSLVRPNKRWDDEDDSCRIESVDLIREGTVLLNAGESDDDDGSKVAGPRRLKMLIGVQPDVPELVFEYYFERFGRLKLSGSK